jgi:prepilin-type N-terminal cleavage/methylation domain-containing protein
LSRLLPSLLRLSRRARRRRSGFTLLEVMIAAGILVVSLTLVVQIQAGAVQGALKAERLVVATDLAQEKIGEVLLLIEAEGVGTADVHERGDFRDYGDEADLEFGDRLDDFEYEYWIEEVELALSGDLMSMFGGMGEDGAAGGDALGAAGSSNENSADLMAQFGFGPEQISEQLGQFVRRIRVRVYWGEESEAAERGREVVITTHIISPTGAFRSLGGDPNNPDGAN